jgi:hypothetical protein
MECEDCGKKRNNKEDKFYSNKCQFEKTLCKSCYTKRLKKKKRENNPDLKCEICGIKNKEKHIRYNTELDKYLCGKHYYQLKRHGKVLERTIYDSNKIVKYKDYAVIFLYNQKGLKIAETKVDLDELREIKRYKWRLTNNGYVKTGDNILLHRFIMNCSNNKVVDHINKDKLDNRKNNLRICEQTHNLMNSKISKDNKSGYKGVGFHKPSKKWRARITVDKKTIYLGLFNSKEDAIKARREAEIKYFGEYHYNYKELKEKGLIE